MFLPTTRNEMDSLGWDELDIILVSGDTYIDSPYSGIALIGKQLLAHGYRVGVIAQPMLKDESDISRLGSPGIFWGVSAGAVDSMVANTTALGKPRRMDDFTPGGQNNRRPNRASIVYTNLIRRYFKDTSPIVLGGVEASLRRLAHYDFWSDSLRRSILLDSKADYLLYGMADTSILELAETLKNGGDPRSLRGLLYADAVFPEDYLELPSMEDCLADKQAFSQMFHSFYENNDPIGARGLAQRFGDRYVIQNPPAATLTTAQMDEVYGHSFEHAVHPYYAAQGEVRAMETIRFAIPTHRGCYGECNFCAIAVHEGRRVSWRSEESIVKEAEQMTQRPGFKGIIHDLSGPTANMYGFECQSVKPLRGACKDKSCIYPNPCPLLGVNHAPATRLMQAVNKVEGVKKVFISSGVRHDMVMQDSQAGPAYLQELVEHHVSGQLKLAPEHSEPWVLRRMRKPSVKTMLAFKEHFDGISARVGKKQFLSYYLLAAHPGCSDADMINLRQFCSTSLGVLPEQVQIFTPTPSTYSSLMYYTERDPFSGEPLFVEKGLTGKMQQKATITGWRQKRSGVENQDRHAYAPFDEDWPDESLEASPSQKGPEGRFDRSRRPCKQDEKRVQETRVIRDDYGHFFNNKMPEGWVDKRAKPGSKFRRTQGRGSGSGRPSERRSGAELWKRRETQELQIGASWEESQKDSRTGAWGKQGERSFRRDSMDHSSERTWSRADKYRGTKRGYSLGSQDGKVWEQRSERRGTDERIGERTEGESRRPKRGMDAAGTQQKPWQKRETDRARRKSADAEGQKGWEHKKTSTRTGQEKTEVGESRAAEHPRSYRERNDAGRAKLPYSGQDRKRRPYAEYERKQGVSPAEDKFGRRSDTAAERRKTKDQQALGGKQYNKNVPSKGRDNKRSHARQAGMGKSGYSRHNENSRRPNGDAKDKEQA